MVTRALSTGKMYSSRRNFDTIIISERKDESGSTIIDLYQSANDQN